MPKEKENSAFKPPFGRIGQVIGIIILFLLFMRMCGSPSVEVQVKPIIVPSLEVAPVVPVSHADAVPETPKTSPLSRATYAEIVATAEPNWDADAEPDGPAAFLEFKDSSGDRIQFTNAAIPITIEIYSIKEYDKDFHAKKGRLIYSGESTMKDSRESSISGNGIRIPFEDIESQGIDNDRGIIVMTATLPDGRKMSAMSERIKIKP